MISGLDTRITSPDTTPAANAVWHSILPYRFACSSLPLPSSFPTMIPLPVPIPRQTQEMIFFMILAIEFAATASFPRCPIMTENIVKPHPHTI